MQNNKNLQEIEEIYEEVDIANIIETAIADIYAEATFSRAFPSVLDGFKESIRRILYAMIDVGCHKANGKLVKTASVVGTCLAKYHPHGDAALYGALVAIAQNFNISYPLLVAGGNFGNHKGDAYAATRYTETKANSFIEDVLFKDFNKNIVLMRPSEIPGEEEPIFFSTRIPLVLLNGAVGIGEAFTCGIPPHNISDVVKMCINVIDNPDISLKELTYNIYPDYPTGGTITNGEEISNAYIDYTKSSNIKIQANIEIDKENNLIIIREFPPNSNFNKIKEELFNLAEKSYHIQRINSIIDKPSAKYPELIEAYIYCNKDANLIEIYNILLTKTSLKNTLPISLRLYNEGKLLLLSIKGIISKWYQTRYRYLEADIKADKNALEIQADILRGLILAHDYMAEITKKIMTADSKEHAMQLVIQTVPKLSASQAKAIVEMQLYKISKKSKDDLAKDLVELERKIQELDAKLLRIPSIIKEQLLELERKYKKPRRTIVLQSKEEIKQEVNINDSVLLYSRNSYLINDIDTFLNTKNVLNGLVNIKINNQNNKEIIGFEKIKENCKGFICFFSDGISSTIPIEKINIINHWVEVTNNPNSYLIKVIPYYNTEDYLYIISDELKLRKVYVSDFISSNSKLQTGLIHNTLYLPKSYDGGVLLLADNGDYVLLEENSETSCVPFTSRKAQGVQTNFAKDSKIIMQKFVFDSNNNYILFFENNESGFMNIVQEDYFIIGNRTNKYKNIIPKNLESDLKVCGISKFVFSNKNIDFNNIFITKNSLQKINSRNLKFNNEFKRISVKPLGNIQIQI